MMDETTSHFFIVEYPVLLLIMSHYRSKWIKSGDCLSGSIPEHITISLIFDKQPIDIYFVMSSSDLFFFHPNVNLYMSTYNYLHDVLVKPLLL